MSRAKSEIWNKNEKSKCKEMKGMKGKLLVKTLSHTHALSSSMFDYGLSAFHPDNIVYGHLDLVFVPIMGQRLYSIWRIGNVRVRVYNMIQNTYLYIFYTYRLGNGIWYPMSL